MNFVRFFGLSFITEFLNYRCIGSNTCAAINGNDPVKHEKPENTDEVCCQGLNPNMQCQPDCVGMIQNRERALSSDVGFYRKFQVHESGRPMGCPAFTDRFLSGQQVNSYTGQVSH